MESEEQTTILSPRVSLPFTILSPRVSPPHPKPLVSVVMPTYNDAAYLGEAIASVLEQDFADFELLICSDGSTDSTEEVVLKYLERDERVQYFKLPHANANVARNHGVEQAWGEYVAFIDSDDRWLPNHLSVCLAAIRRNACDGVYSGMLREKKDGSFTKCYNGPPNEGETWVSFILRTGVSTQTDGLFLTTASARSTGWDEAMLRHQDYDFVARYAEAYAFRPTGAHTFCYLRRPAKARSIHFASCIAFVERHLPDIAPEVLRRYAIGMLNTAQAKGAAPEVVAYYRKLAAQPAGAVAAAPVAEAPLTGSPLTVVIPFLNEGEEVEKTVASVRATAATNPNIILINDASTDGYAYRAVAERHGCWYAEHVERRGVAASRDHGVALAQTAYILILDAHMEMYGQGWDERVVGLLAEHPRAVLCSQTLPITADRAVKRRPSTYGAYIRLPQLSATWVSFDRHPQASVVPVGCVLGAAYASRKDYYERLHGLRGLLSYGSDEELISLKVLCEGGELLLVKDWETGHLYRKAARAPFPRPAAECCFNKLLIAELFFQGRMKYAIFASLRERYGKSFEVALLELCCQHGETIAAEKEYLSTVLNGELLRRVATRMNPGGVEITVPPDGAAAGAAVAAEATMHCTENESYLRETP